MRKVVGYVTADGKTQSVNGSVVLAAGCRTTQLARTAGIDVPLYPMKGYSITVDVPLGLEADLVPRGLIILEPMHTYVIRMAPNRVRFASIAELNGWDEAIKNPK